MNNRQLCSSGNRKAHPFTVACPTEGFNLPWCHWKGDMKRDAPWCSAKGIVKHLMAAEAGVHWQDCCKNCCCTNKAPLRCHSAPRGAALLQSDVKIHPVEIYIHFVYMWVTTEGKVQLKIWPRAGQTFLVLLRKHLHQVNSADSTLSKCFCVDFTLLQPIDYDYFLNLKIKCLYFYNYIRVFLGSL